jgi:xanthine dehydrogenase YagS FAD-binding subunit
MSVGLAFPKTVAALAQATGEVRAGGTDLQERRALGVSKGDLRDMRDVSGLGTISEAGEGVEIGARATVAAVAAHPLIARYPGLKAAAGGLATPQIRAVATVGGNLLQEVRCWYYRNPDTRCLKRGGAECLAREGDNLYSACFDLGPCVAPHPSTVGAALLAYEAEAHVYPTGPRTMEALFGDGSDPTRTHTLLHHEILTKVRLPEAIPGERGGYFRAISRARAEWSLVEVVVRLVLDDDKRIRLARVAMGGVANIPLRLRAVEERLTGSLADQATFEDAGRIGKAGASPLRMTAYKVDLIPQTIVETLESAMT